VTENVVIIGAGCAGLSAAIYTSREGFRPLVIGGAGYGGQLMLTTLVENYPGFPNGVMGPELMAQMRKQAERFGTRFVDSEVIEVDFSTKPFRVKTASGSYDALSVIVATGASSKLLGIPSEAKYMGKGVSMCSTCDAPFFKGKDVVVVGGGDTAMEDSLFLTRFATSVTIVHRRDEFRASKIMQEKVLKNEKVKVLWNSAVEEITGDGNRVTGVRIKNLKTNEVKAVATGGVFIAVGHVPTTKFLEGKLELDERGYIVTKDEVLTKIDGVFVAGDAADPFYRQAVTSASGGVKAALRVRDYFNRLGIATK
jgi:thioredoxin reductase (NADPH)